MDDGIEIPIPDKIKTSRPGAPQPVLKIHFFREKPELCTAKTLNYYLAASKDLRADTNSLFISFQKSHKAVKSETISRWIKSTLGELGVDRRFTAHYTRHTSTSKAYGKGVSIEEIRKVAGWSRESTVFAKFYHRPINSKNNNFAKAVLSPSMPE